LSFFYKSNSLYDLNSSVYPMKMHFRFCPLEYAFLLCCMCICHIHNQRFWDDLLVVSSCGTTTSSDCFGLCLYQRQNLFCLS
jgi:hypothetical protein